MGSRGFATLRISAAPCLNVARSGFYMSMPPRARGALLLAILFAAAMGYYHLEIFLPHARAMHAAHGLGNGYFFGNDFYPIWLTSREWAFDQRDPYSPEMTRAIQIGLFGRSLDPRNPLDPDAGYRTFSYPAFTDILALPLAGMHFAAARVLLALLFPLLLALAVLLWVRFFGGRTSPDRLAILIILTLFSYPGLEAVFALQWGLARPVSAGCVLGRFGEEPDLVGRMLAGACHHQTSVDRSAGFLSPAVDPRRLARAPGIRLRFSRGGGATRDQCPADLAKLDFRVVAGVVRLPKIYLSAAGQRSLGAACGGGADGWAPGSRAGPRVAHASGICRIGRVRSDGQPAAGHLGGDAGSERRGVRPSGPAARHRLSAAVLAPLGPGESGLSDRAGSFHRGCPLAGDRRHGRHRHAGCAPSGGLGDLAAGSYSGLCALRDSGRAGFGDA